MTSMSKLMVAALTLGVLVGCGATELDESAEPTREQLQELVIQAESAPDAFAVPACPAVTNCGAEFANCTSWTTPAFCGNGSACNATGCRVCEIDDDGNITFCENHGSATQETYRYRTCFNVNGQTCTQTEVWTSNLCGCNSW